MKTERFNDERKTELRRKGNTRKTKRLPIGIFVIKSESFNKT